MATIRNSDLEMFEIAGIQHQTVGGVQQGVKTMEVWSQTIAPGAGTPIHRHACEEVIVILTGAGECTADGEVTKFGPNSTLTLAPNVVHQIVNTSGEEMKLIAALGMSPVKVETADGSPMPLPWQQDR